jgi:HEAT repeat protein
MTIAGNNDESLRLRRRAVQLTERAGTPISDVAQLYDRADDPQMKDAIISTLSSNGTKAATDKLLAIAKSDQNYAMRRRAVNALARSEDPRVKDALKDIVEK